MMYETRYFWHCGKRVEFTDKRMVDPVYEFLGRLGPTLQRAGLTPQNAAIVATHVLHDKLYPDLDAALEDSGVKFHHRVDPMAIMTAIDLGLMTPTTTGGDTE